MEINNPDVDCCSHVRHWTGKQFRFWLVLYDIHNVLKVYYIYLSEVRRVREYAVIVRGAKVKKLAIELIPRLGLRLCLCYK